MPAPTPDPSPDPLETDAFAAPLAREGPARARWMLHVLAR